jgi:pSer/pThr/pTyr-binding forkhead associated (FHA) protein
MEVKLIVASGRAKGRVIPLPGKVFVIGRGKQAHLRAHCLRVSKLHCAIACWGGKVVLRDLKSANGTYLNEERVHGEAHVQNGDVLCVGTLKFTFDVPADLLAPPPSPEIRASEVQWLLDSAKEAPPPKSADTVCEAWATLLAKAQAANDTAEEQALSAGDLLRDSVRPRR